MFLTSAISLVASSAPTSSRGALLSLCLRHVPMFYARYNKARGRPTLYVCGTDEYGTATETKALEEKVEPEELCAKYYKIHAEVYEWFEIAFDIFGRTPTKHHTQIAQDVFLKLYKNLLLSEKTNEQPYCDS